MCIVQAATLLKQAEGIVTLVVCNPKRDMADAAGKDSDSSEYCGFEFTNI